MPQDKGSLPGYDPSTNRFSAPPYFGSESTALLNLINDQIADREVLGKVIAFGTVLSVATDTTPEMLAKRSHDFTPVVQAMALVPVILRDEIKTQVQLALAGPAFKKMNQQERNFWEAVEKNIKNPPKRPPAEDERPHDMSGALCHCGSRGAHGGQTR